MIQNSCTHRNSSPLVTTSDSTVFDYEDTEHLSHPLISGLTTRSQVSPFPCILHPALLPSIPFVRQSSSISKRSCATLQHRLRPQHQVQSGWGGTKHVAPTNPLAGRLGQHHNDFRTPPLCFTKQRCTPPRRQLMGRAALCR